MKTKSIPNLKFKDLGNDAFSVSTPTEHISLNSVILLVAKKQSDFLCVQFDEPIKTGEGV